MCIILFLQPPLYLHPIFHSDLHKMAYTLHIPPDVVCGTVRIYVGCLWRSYIDQMLKSQAEAVSVSFWYFIRDLTWNGLKHMSICFSGLSNRRHSLTLHILLVKMYLVSFCPTKKYIFFNVDRTSFHWSFVSPCCWVQTQKAPLSYFSVKTKQLLLQ